MENKIQRVTHVGRRKKELGKVSFFVLSQYGKLR
jgi:hypothetical protein